MTAIPTAPIDETTLHIMLRYGSVQVPIAAVQEVLAAHGMPGAADTEALAILTAVAEAQSLFGGTTFVPLGKSFAELPELFAAFRAAQALGADTWPLQQILLAGLLPQNLLEETPHE